MVHRRRSTIPRLACLCASLSCGGLQAASLIELTPGAAALRFPLPDSIYAAGVNSNFSNLQIVDGSNRSLLYAVCAVQSISQRSTEVPILAKPDIARPALDSANQIVLQWPRGARASDRITDWIVDLRGLRTPALELVGAAAISDLRSSPNLQQWSAPIAFQQTGDRLVFDPLRANFLRLSLATPTDQPPELATLQVNLEEIAGERAAHWYPVSPDATGIYRNTRQLPVLAARVRAASPGQSWKLESRQGAWDAWKPRNRIQAGQASSTIHFSAVTDPQWRIDGLEDGVLELGHAAYELRLPKIEAAQAPLQIQLRDSGNFGPQLSCRSTEHLPTQAPAQLKPLQTTASIPANTPPANLRWRFLLAVLALALVGYFSQRLLKRKRAG